MAEKDVTEKVLEAYNDVFADIVNVLLFDGQEIIKEDELTDQAPRSAYKIDGKVREIERDVAKRWMKQDIRIACVGFENQTAVDVDMPLRCFAYDGAEYRAQLSEKERYPVVTLVLYFGYNRRWNKPRSLAERLSIPDVFKPYVQDYRLNLFEIAYLSDEQVRMFKSDFRIVADYFVQMRKNHDYKPDPLDMVHIQEVLRMMSVLTQDRRFEEAYDYEPKGRVRNMCEVLDRLISEGEAVGLAKGEAKGESLLADLIEKLFSSGRTDDVLRVSKDPEYRHKLYLEFGIE